MNGLLALVLTLSASRPARRAHPRAGAPDRADGVLSLLLEVLFFAVQAPDVALSELVVGTVAVPLMLLLAIGKIREHRARERERRE